MKNRGIYRSGMWRLELEPDAAMLFKRLFPRADAAEVGWLHLQHNPEFAADLDWFSKRHGIEWFDDLTRQKLAEGVEEYRHHRSLVDRMLDKGYVPPAFKGLAIEPRPYQRVGTALALEAKRMILGDDTGIGKSIQAFGMFTERRTLPAIYITLTAIPGQVQEMLAEALPNLRSVVLKSGRPYDFTKKPRSRKGEKLPFPDVVILSYSKVRGWADHLAKMGFKTLILDEAHELRHPTTERYRAVFGLAGFMEFVLAMTATPVFGMGSQIYYLVNLVRHGVLGRWDEFVREWCKRTGVEDRATGDDKPAIRDPDALGEHLRRNAIMLRRRCDDPDVAQHLPRMQRIFLPIEIDERPLQDVKDIALQLAKQFLEQGARGITKMKAGGQLELRLRQATGIAKAKYVAEFVAQLLEQGEKVLVYAWHREVYAILLARLKHWNPAMFTGSESPKQKADSLRRFKSNTDEDRTPALFMSLRSGAGIDGLQYAGCRIGVYAELDWSPAIHEQGEGRLNRFRRGGPVPITFYYPVAQMGSDPPFMELLGLKEDQLIGLRDPGAPRVRKKIDQQAVRERITRLARSFLREHEPSALPPAPAVANDAGGGEAQALEDDAEIVAEAARLAEEAEALELEALGDDLVADEPAAMTAEDAIESDPTPPLPAASAPPPAPSPPAVDPWLARAMQYS